MRIYSFVTQSYTNSWCVNFRNFFNYVSNNRGFPPSSQFLIRKYCSSHTSSSCFLSFYPCAIRHQAFHRRSRDLHYFKLDHVGQLKRYLFYLQLKARCWLEKNVVFKLQGLTDLYCLGFGLNTSRN
ncbi:hypothetical protein BKA67DRAFT_680853 [Truncatella angustata]|uniref:Uncharacterized protein n=1 Tax=Truncatella angustata TaxID=152316 RepID=A0A9P8ZWT6_9PEZI|nr:uncharacterized protein BKA67DRAFT_680853 [Truncatella angustata]KAH6652308.1 hypothetical protein BKA67DRAFT_680853 [Truncatella angustata]